MLTKIHTFLKAWFWHVYSGSPKSSQEQINQRLAICAGTETIPKCEFYDNQESVCTICGCSVNNKKTFFNKLAWLDQKCPEKKW